MRVREKKRERESMEAIGHERAMKIKGGRREANGKEEEYGRDFNVLT